MFRKGCIHAMALSSEEAECPLFWVSMGEVQILAPLVACLASAAVGFYAHSRHFLHFGCVQTGARKRPSFYMWPNSKKCFKCAENVKEMLAMRASLLDLMFF